MSSTPLKVVKQAQIAIDLLTPEDRICLERAVSQLAGKAPPDWPAEIVEPLPADQPLYLLHFTPDLRAFVVPASDGGVEVQQIVHRKTLEWFQSPGVNGGAAE
jgi:hypothetical protein